jgi:hypothetical protein
MAARVVRTLVMMTVGGLLMVMAFANAGAVGASLPDRAFQVMGCNIGDYTCYYARTGESAAYTYYCNAGYFTCTNGVPDTTAQYLANVSPYCGDGGGAGCINGSPLYVNTTPVTANGSGLAVNVVVTSGFVNSGTSGTRVVRP